MRHSILCRPLLEILRCNMLAALRNTYRPPFRRVARFDSGSIFRRPGTNSTLNAIFVTDMRVVELMDITGTMPINRHINLVGRQGMPAT